MKKFIWVTLLLVLTSALVLGACAQPAPTTTAPAPTTSAPPPASAQPIELRFSTHVPPFAPPVKAYNAWAEEVGKATNGKVKITVFSGGQLLQGGDVVAGVKSGIADIGHVVIEMVANERPLTPILSLPFMGLGDWQQGLKVADTLRKEFPALNDEWKDFKVLFRELRTGTGIHAKKAILVPVDIKGQKVIATGMMADIVNSLGGSAISLDLPDWYTSLDRGLATAMFMDLGAVYEMKLHTLIPNHTDFPRGMSFNIGQFVMNQDVWNKLPADVQQAITDVSVNMEVNLAQGTEDVNKQYKADMEKDSSQKFIMLTDAQAEQWLKAAAEEHKKYLAKADAKGLPATAIYNRAVELGKQIK